MLVYKPALLEVYLRMERDITIYDWALGQREIGQRYGNEGQVEHFTKLVCEKEVAITQERKYFLRDVGIPASLWGLRSYHPGSEYELEETGAEEGNDDDYGCEK